MTAPDSALDDLLRLAHGDPYAEDLVTGAFAAGLAAGKTAAPAPGVLTTAADAAMTSLYRQLDSQDLPGDPGFDAEAGLRDLAARAEAAQGALDERGTLAQALDRLLAVIATAPQLPRAALADCRLCRNRVLYLLDTRESYGVMRARLRSLTYAHESHPRDPALAASHADARPPQIRGMQS